MTVQRLAPVTGERDEVRGGEDEIILGDSDLERAHWVRIADCGLRIGRNRHSQCRQFPMWGKAWGSNSGMAVII
jgi:hypothetical protein